VHRGVIGGMEISPTGRRLVAASLIVTAALSAVSNATAPSFPSEYADQLTEFADAGGLAWLSATAFVLAQLPFLLAMLGLGILTRTSAPRLATTATVLTVLGGFGHAVFGGVSLTTLVLAADEANRNVHAEILADVESSPIIAFAALGLIGTVIGLLVLAVALWRGRFGPRWVPVLLGLFLVTEFAGSAISEWSSQLSAVMYVVSFVALAREVLTHDIGETGAGIPGDVRNQSLPA
jgi:hypothetical protein